VSIASALETTHFSRWRVEPRLSLTETKQVGTHGLFLMVSCSCRENRFHLAIFKLKNSQWHIHIDFEQKRAVHKVFLLCELLDRKYRKIAEEAKKKTGAPAGLGFV